MEISVGSVNVSDFSFLSITSVSSYLWIAVSVTFCVIFLWMIICRVVDCWIKRQSFESFYRFCQNVQINLPIIWKVWNISLCIGRDEGLTESIHSHIIGVNFGFMFFLFHFCHEFTDCLSKILVGQWCIVMIVIVSYSFQQLRILFAFWGGYACSFIRHIKSVQKILTTIEYFKIARHFICNWGLLIHCLILFVFLFVYIFLNSLWFVFLHRTFVDDDAFWFILVRRTDLR